MIERKNNKSFCENITPSKCRFCCFRNRESSTGDAAKRAGNEFLFQMQAVTNIEVLNAYEVKTIVTCDPHSFNTLKNEYPSLGGKYTVFHHTQYIKKLIADGRLSVNDSILKNKRLTYHDPCY